MTADWTDTPSNWQNPHERSFYREQQPPPPPPPSVGYPNSFTGLSEESKLKQRRLQDSLDKVLGPEYIATRPGGGGSKLTYLEGWRAINLANEVFGYNGWFTDIKYLEIDFCDFNPENQRWNIGVTAIVRVRLPDGASHEDIGYGKLENSKSKGDGLDKCKKEAVTDGLKRALRHFGKLLGNCLYDKHYLTQLSSMKAQKPKFDWETLYKPQHHSLNATLPKPIPPPSNDLPPPHPPHMQRAQTVGATTVKTNNQAQIQKTNPPPQRSVTISHPSTAVPPQRLETVNSDGLGYEEADDSIFESIPEEMMMINKTTGGGGDSSSGTLDDSGFVETSFLRQESIKPSRPPPPSSVNVRAQPRPSSSNNPPPPPPMTKEEKHQAALAIREKRDREKQAAAAQLQQQQQQQRQGVTGGVGVGGTSTTTAAQLLKTQQQPLPKLRPPVAPPSRSNSINNNNSKPTVSQPRQAGTLPILNPGHTQRQVTPPMIPASGGVSQGFMSAKGIKRKSTTTTEEEGGGVGPFKSHTVSISNPSTAATRQPLGELDVTDQGQIKRFRAS